MWRDDALLLDMLLAAEQVREYVAGLSNEQFRSQRITQDAVIRQLLILGEAARHVSEPRQTAIPQIDWSGLIGLRNVLVHQYFRLELDRIWEIAAKEMPPLIIILEPLVPPENPP